MDISSIHQVSAVTAPAETPAPQAGEDRSALIHAVQAVNAAELFGGQNELAFAVDRPTRRAVVRIVDRETREVIQQIPSEQVLRMAEELQQRG